MKSKYPACQSCAAGRLNAKIGAVARMQNPVASRESSEC